MTKYHNKALSCNFCQKKFTLPAALKEHRIKNHIIFPTKCEECGIYCETRDFYKQHLIDYHNQKLSKGAYTCEVCGKVFEGLNNLKIHSVVHQQKREVFACDTCGQTYNTKTPSVQKDEKCSLFQDDWPLAMASVLVQNLQVAAHSGQFNIYC